MVMHNLPYNGRKPLLRSAAMKQIARFATAFAASVVLAGVAFADPYRVKDIVVDKVAPSAPLATQQGTAEARITGAQRLIERLTLPEDRNAARSPLDATEVSRFFKGSITQVEQKTSSVAGGVRSTGVVTWSYRESEVRAYLESKGVPYVDTQASLAMIVPVAAAGIDPKAWAAQWQQTVNGQTSAKSDDTVLTPYVASGEAWNRRPQWMEIQEELTSLKADHGVIAEVYTQSGQYYVRLVDMRTGIPDPNMGLAGPFGDLAAAQRGAVLEMERAWKMASIVRTSGSASVSLIASFTSIGEWVKIRRSLEGSRLISGLNIESLSNAGADLTFTYAGRSEQLVADLRSRGIDLRNAGDTWVLQVSTQQQ